MAEGLTYHQIVSRLEAIESDLADRLVDYEQAAERKFRLAREFELRHAQAFVAARGATATERKAHATLAVAAAEDGLWTRVAEAEGEYEGLRAAVKVLEQRAMIGMALLKAQTRESGLSPQWSRAA